jgi:hypothetical protein
LDEAGREHEIARMIAGAQVSPQVLASAREMLQLRRNERIGEHKTKDESERPGLAKAKGTRGGA